MDFIRNNWWYILIIGGFIFMMFRGGGCCGAHTEDNQTHGDGGCCGGHSQGTQNNTNRYSGISSDRQGFNSIQTSQVIDPVCGMSINADNAIRETKDGQTYYFCSESCRREFTNKNPHTH